VHHLPLLRMAQLHKHLQGHVQERGTRGMGTQEAD
jgi:hypothetical protein